MLLSQIHSSDSRNTMEISKELKTLVMAEGNPSFLSRNKLIIDITILLDF